jgi:hypothetical protein
MLPSTASKAVMAIICAAALEADHRRLERRRWW